jgi:4'-phosphopantetheinyl transferase
MHRNGAGNLSAAWPVGPERPAAPLGEVHVWRTALDDADADAAGLPAEERHRAERIRRPGESRRWIGSRLALRNVLARYLDEDADAIQLTTGPHGKPELVDRRPHFNLSHSGEIALVAVSEEIEVGVDIERIDPGRDFLAIAARALGPDAVAALQATEAAERGNAFYDLWARREALLKCGGGGLAGPEPEGPVALSALPVDCGYAAALAVASPEPLPFRGFSLRRR